jgi:PAS domain S-box-containing protein
MRYTPLVVNNLKELPAEASTLREILVANHIRSFTRFPLLHKAGLIGTLSFSTTRSERKWDINTVHAMTAIARIFASALDRKRAEQIAQESSQRLAAIVESAIDAVIAIDTEHHIVVFNTAAEKMFGCVAADAMGSSIERFIPGRFRTQHSNKIHRFEETGETTRSMGSLGTLMALRANGVEFPIESSISQVKTSSGKLFTAIIRDNTERDRAELQLRESYELNLSILQSLKNHLAVLDANGTIIAATAREPEFVAVSGLNLLDLRVGENFMEICRAAIESGDREVAIALDGVKAVYGGIKKYFEMQYNYKKGIEQRWFLMTVTPMREPGHGVVISHEEITVRKRHEQAIQELSGRLIAAQEQERSRIARELHDDINQQVAMLAIELQQLKTYFPKDSIQVNEKVDALWEKTHALSLDIQQLSHQLHSTKLDHLGIVGALRGLCTETSDQCKIEIEFQFKQVQAGISTGIALSIFRVAQEALHNVAKHSHASKVNMELFGSGNSIILRITDNGVGFDSEKNQNASGLGMISMSERIRLVGGTLTVTSKPSQGTQIEAKIPLSSGAVDA